MPALLAQVGLMERILHGRTWALSHGLCCDQLIPVP